MPFRFSGSAALPVLTASPATDRDSPAERHRKLFEREVVALFDEFRVPLLRYLASFGLAFADSEEVIQETFLALFQHLSRGKSRDNRRGWLFRVAHNLALKRWRRTRRDSESLAASGAEDLAIDPGPNPEDLLLAGFARRRLLAVVDALPEQDRRCLLLRAEGLRYREIARVLDMSLGAVALSLSRSLARMARSVER